MSMPQTLEELKVQDAELTHRILNRQSGAMPGHKWGLANILIAERAAVRERIAELTKEQPCVP